MAMEKTENYYRCKLCQRTSGDVGYNFVMDCSVMNDERNELWDSLNDNLHVMELRDLFNLDDEDLVIPVNLYKHGLLWFGCQ